jgi:hypothetical protein
LHFFVEEQSIQHKTPQTTINGYNPRIEDIEPKKLQSKPLTSHLFETQNNKPLSRKNSTPISEHKTLSFEASCCNPLRNILVVVGATLVLRVNLG